MSFVGGGSDLSAYYHMRPGAVISSTINKYIYVTVNKKYDDTIRVSYSKNEIVRHVDAVEHDIIRSALKLVGIDRGIEIVYVSDLPLRDIGTGLGASSALAVGVLNALYAYKGEVVSPERLADDACRIEIKMLGRPAGKQDQYAAAYGGLNVIEFHPDERVMVRPVICDEILRKNFSNHLLLFYTGTPAKSSKVLEEQMEKTKDNKSVLDEMVAFVPAFEHALSRGDFIQCAALLHENWIRKQRLAHVITNSEIDEQYEKARSAGARGGKILGSGGGGFLLLYCDEADQHGVRKALADLKEMPFQFEERGSTLIYHDD